MAIKQRYQEEPIEHIEKELYEFMLNEIKSQGISFYRISRDLNLNFGNIQNRVKTGNGFRISTVLRIFNYLGYTIKIIKKNKTTTMNNLPLDGAYLRLLQRLITHFPEKADDTEFIQMRADASNAAFEQARLNGDSVGEAKSYAEDILYAGLYFSKHDTIMEALRELYPNAGESNLRSVALVFFNDCLPFFEKYTMDDAFETSLEYENKLLPALVDFLSDSDKLLARMVELGLADKDYPYLLNESSQKC